jgi:glycerophosphoryl diester phosphodiesterase
MIVAHRGDTSMGARENTVEAIAAATLTGADMVEVDVQMSADGVFVCHHDEKMPDGRRLSDMSLDELQSQGVSKLTDILGTAIGKVYFNLEIKEYSARDPRAFMQGLIALLEQRRLQDQVLFSSFRIDYIREAGWHIPTALIRPDEDMQRFFDSRSQTPVAFTKPIVDYLPSELLALSRATGYACSIDELNARDLADINKHNIFFSIYTITTKEEFDRAIQGGAQGLVCENAREFAELRNRLYPAIYPAQ